MSDGHLVGILKTEAACVCDAMISVNFIIPIMGVDPFCVRYPSFLFFSFFLSLSSECIQRINQRIQNL